MYRWKAGRYDLWEMCALLEGQLRSRQDTVPAASQNRCLLLEEEVPTMRVSLAAEECEKHKVNLHSFYRPGLR